MNIYAIGGGEIVYEVLSAVALCLHGDSGSLMHGFLHIGMVVGAIMLYMSVVTNNWLEIVKSWLAPVSFIMYVFFLPTTTVWVHDDVSKFHKKLDHVPYGLGMFASYFSTAGKFITERIEQNFSMPDDLSYHKTGMMFGSDILEKAKTFRITNTNLKENMRNFVGQCVKYDIMLNSKYTFDQLKNTPDIWSLVSENPSANRGIFWLPAEGGRSEYVTCAQAVKKFNSVWKREIERTSLNLGLKFFSGRAIGHSTLEGKFKVSQQLAETLKSEMLANLQSTYAYLGELEQSSEELMKQNMLVNAMEDAASSNANLSGNVLAYSEAKSLFQQRITYETLGRMAAKVLPIMKAVLEALVYACFIFIIPLCMIPNGYKFLINWCGALVWLQAWAPLYAILNYIMNIAARASTLAEIGLSGGITIANIAGVSEANAEMKALAGYLALSIPFICIAIVSGVGSFVHLAGQLTGAASQVGSSSAAEVSGGNFSYGNISVGNRQMGNVSSLQRSFGSSISGADHMLMNGVEQIKFGADGSFISHDQYSSGKVDGHYDTNTLIAQGFAIQNSKSELRSMQEALTEAQSIRESGTMDMAYQISNINSSTEGSSELVKAAQSRRMQSALRIVQNHGKSDDYSQGTGANLGIGAKIGVGGGISAEARNSHSFSESQQAQNDMSYSEAEDIVKDFSRKAASSSTSSETRNAASRYVQSVDKVDSLTSSINQQKQWLQSATDSYNKNLNTSFNISEKGMLDDVREEMAKHGISPEESMRMIRRGDSMAKAAFDTVKDQKMHSIPRGVAASNKFPERNLKGEYNEKRSALAGVNGMQYEPNTGVDDRVKDQIQGVSSDISGIKESM